MHLLVLVVLFFTSEAAKLPKTWKTCSRSDPGLNDCLKDAFQNVIPDLVHGQPSLGVLPIDPLRFDAISIDQGSGPVTIKVDFQDLELRGLRFFNVTSVKTDWRKMEVNLVTTRKIDITGGYKIKGRVLILPIVGDGACNLQFDDMDLTLFMQMSKKKKTKGNFYYVDDFQIKFDSSRFQMNFENLFNGDKRLGDNMNKFLNENWREILDELKITISYSFGSAFKQIANRVFSRVEVNAISPP